MRALVLENPSDPTSLSLKDFTLPTPGAGEFRLKFSSIGLNRADILYPQGRYFFKPKAGSRIGFEGAGTVDAVGPGVTLPVGTRGGLCPSSFDVATQGCIAEYGIYKVKDLLPTPKNLPDEQAGTIWMAYLTAWGGMVEAGALSEGETVVITAASSSVGIAAIQIANMLGAITIATTTSEAKADRLKELGAQQVIVQNKDNEDPIAHYVDQVRAYTNGCGSHLVFDAVAGPASHALIKASIRGGRIVIHGMLDRRPMDIHAGVLMKRLLTLRGYTIDQTLNDDTKKQKAVAALLKGFEAKQLAPIVDHQFSLDEFQQALNYLASNQHIGKIVICPN